MRDHTLCSFSLSALSNWKNLLETALMYSYILTVWQPCLDLVLTLRLHLNQPLLLKSISCLFVRLFFGCAHGMQKFPGQESKLAPQQWQHRICNRLSHEGTPSKYFRILFFTGWKRASVLTSIQVPEILDSLFSSSFHLQRGQFCFKFISFL